MNSLQWNTDFYENLMDLTSFNYISKQWHRIGQPINFKFSHALFDTQCKHKFTASNSQLSTEKQYLKQIWGRIEMMIPIRHNQQI